MNFCPQCGAKLALDDIFCPQCGTYLNDKNQHPNVHVNINVDILESYLATNHYNNIRTFTQTDILSIPDILNRLAPQADCLAQLHKEFPQNKIYTNNLSSIEYVIKTIKAQSESNLSQQLIDILLHLQSLWFAIANVLKDMDALQYHDEIILYTEYGQQIEYILNHTSRTSHNSTKTTQEQANNDFDPCVIQEIENLSLELQEQKPSFKRIHYDPNTNYRQELEDLIGLDDIKAQIANHIIDIQIQAKRKQIYPDLKFTPSFNCIFKGKPGTGKTTVARLIAGILKQEGLISNGCYVEVDASTLISGWVGFSAKIAKLAALQSFGGVLFIDEAYSLMNAQGSKSNPGAEVIDTLTPLMENYRDKLTIILAGYDKEMEEFMANANTGFPSRFNTIFQFNDYSADEMYDIFMHFTNDNHYKLTTNAAKRLQTILGLIYDKKDSLISFANARTVRLLFEAVRAKASRRMATEANPDLSLITVEDMSLNKQELTSIIGKF